MAKQSLRIGGFQAPFHLALGKDEVRPHLRQAHFINGFVYATDAKILIRQSLTKSHGLSEEQAQILEGKRLHENKLRILWEAESVEFKPDGIEFKHKLGVKMRMDYDTNNDPLPFDFESVFPKAYVDGGLDRIGINPAVLERLRKAMDAYDGAISLHFAGRSKPIVVVDGKISTCTSYGIIMPLMVPEDTNFPT